jgi:glycosyltransferase involved in cell wall biosynthesis
MKIKLSVLIPIYNEKGTIEDLLKKVNQVKIDKEIIVVDDGSTDRTPEILQNLKDYYDKLILMPNNTGKGFAIRKALEHASGDIIIIQDGDLEYDPNDYHKLVEPITTGKADVVYGSRNLKPHMHSYYRYYWGGRILTILTNFLYNSKISDEPTCYKVFKADVLKSINLKCTKFEFCPEVTAKILKKGYPIVEVPISYNPRKFINGKKIKFKDGIHAIWTLLKYRIIS